MRVAVKKCCIPTHLQPHTYHWVPLCRVVAMSKMEAVLFLLGSNIEVSWKNFPLYLLCRIFIYSHHSELDSPSMWQAHCITSFFPRKYSFHAAVVFSTKAFGICLPFWFHIKNIWRALKNTDFESIGLGRFWNLSSIKFHWWILYSARFQSMCVRSPPKTKHRFTDSLGLMGLLIAGIYYNQQRENVHGAKSEKNQAWASKRLLPM